MVLRWLNHAESTDSESSQATEWRDIVLFHAAKWQQRLKVASPAANRQSSVSINCAAHQDNTLQARIQKKLDEELPQE